MPTACGKICILVSLIPRPSPHERAKQPLFLTLFVWSCREGRRTRLFSSMTYILASHGSRIIILLLMVTTGVEVICDTDTAKTLKTQHVPKGHECVTNFRGYDCLRGTPEKQASIAGSEESSSSWQSTGAGSVTSEPQTQAFGCGCKNCSFEDFLEKGCPNPTSTSSFPSLDTEELSHSQQQTLRGKLYHEFEKITTAFSSLFSDTCKSLVHRDISVEELVLVLTTLGAFQPTLPQMPLLEEQLVEMSKAKNNYKVFFALRGYVSFFSHHIIDHIIAKLGTPEDHQRLQSYRHTLDDYMKRSVFECPAYSTARRQQVNLVVKVEGEMDRYKMHHLEAFQSQFSNIIKVSEYTLRLCTVEKGCLLLTYQVPHFVSDTIFPLSDEQKSMLRAEGVTWLSSGNYYDHLSNQVSVQIYKSMGSNIHCAHLETQTTEPLLVISNQMSTQAG